ncbi:glycosyltransferase family 2 protein [Parabacteroides merdae]|jgi:GT2 family glycosyltransferase|nr:glycosyltransferase family 2 protein [Parabacteroides merdae]
MSKIAIIILNYNSSADCRKCVGFLLRQQGVDLEIIIVDNCSRPDDRQAVEVLCKEHGLTYISAKENRGYNAGNNIGLRYATEKEYKYAMIANPDMEFPQENYVARMVEKMEEDEEIVVCGSDIVTPEGRHQNPQRESTYQEELLWPITYLRYHRKGDWFLEDYSKAGYCEKISGCCLMVRMNFIEHIDFFDEGVFLYSEESILAKQLQLNKRKMYYLKDAYAIHRHVKSEKGNPASNLLKLFSSREYYLSKYSGYSRFSLKMLLLSKSLQKLFYEKICFHL